jgi:TonB family protein
MNFQALLFCPDEKTARVTTQVLTELEFSVEACAEPFGAVKKLMGQHFDAIVVDCENEQNASLLFKSARNSSSNQASLAVAVVEGQAGVANAFRIGANLVLTKPINVEQAKSTLRVARGLLRKGSESAKPATSPSAPAANIGDSTTPAVAPSMPKQPDGVPVISARSSRPTAPVFGAEKPSFPVPSQPQAPGALAKTSVEPNSGAVTPNKTISAPAAEPDLFEVHQPSTMEKVSAQEYPWQPVSKATGTMATSVQRAESAGDKFTVPDKAAVQARASVSPESAKASVTPAVKVPPAFASSVGSGGAASAPAPARETPKAPVPSSAFDAEQSMAPMPAKAPEKRSEKQANKSELGMLFAAASSSPAPTFGMESAEAATGQSGSKTGMLLAVAAVVLAVGGYFGYTKFAGGKQSAEPAAATTSASTAAPNTPVIEPSGPASAIVTATAPNTGTSTAAKSTPTAPNEEASDEEPEVSVTHPAEAGKLVVKSGVGERSGAKAAAAADIAAPTLGRSEDQSAISNLVQSVPVAVPKVAAPQATLRVSQGVTQGLLTKRVQPAYPPQALQMHIQGAVQLMATISKEGKIKSVQILSGDPILARAAADAVSQWRYKPYFLNGEPVEIQTQIMVNFKLP